LGEAQNSLGKKKKGSPTYNHRETKREIERGKKGSNNPLVSRLDWFE